jgi:hypothetical protein
MQMSDIGALEQLDESSVNEFSSFSDNLIDYGEEDSEIKTDTIEVVPKKQEKRVLITDIQLKNGDEPERMIHEPKTAIISAEDPDSLSDEILDDITPMLFSMPEMESSENDQ